MTMFADSELSIFAPFYTTEQYQPFGTTIGVMYGLLRQEVTYSYQELMFEENITRIISELTIRSQLLVDFNLLGVATDETNPGIWFASTVLSLSDFETHQELCQILVTLNMSSLCSDCASETMLSAAFSFWSMITRMMNRYWGERLRILREKIDGISVISLRASLRNQVFNLKSDLLPIYEYSFRFSEIEERISEIEADILEAVASAY